MSDGGEASLQARQEAPEQSAATPSAQEVVLSNAVARGKTLMVLSRPECSRGYADAGASQRQEEAETSQQQEQPRTTHAAESDDDVLEEIQGHLQDEHQHVYVCSQRGDHYICHEEIPTVDETRKVKLAAKRLIAEV
jgi:hypothetical protein